MLNNTFLVYMVMEWSVANHQYWFLEENVIVVLLPWLLDTPSIYGNTLVTFKTHELAFEESQTMIEFMSSVDLEYSKSYYFALLTRYKYIYLFYQQDGNLVTRWERRRRQD